MALSDYKAWCLVLIILVGCAKEQTIKVTCPFVVGSAEDLGHVWVRDVKMPCGETAYILEPGPCPGHTLEIK